MMRRAVPAFAVIGLLVLQAASPAATPGVAEIERLSKTGVTLSPEISARFPLDKQRIPNDTGINVLVDLAHQANFFTMWHLPGMLRKHGFRASGSQAALDTVLTPGQPCRIRIHLEGRRRPFAWWPAARFNVVFTLQEDPNSQQYLPEEIEALKSFVRSGGGLVMVGGRVRRAKALATWPLNRLAGEFGASLTTESDSIGDMRASVLQLDSTWQTHVEGADGKPLVARRTFGKGRVVLIGSSSLVDVRGAPRDQARSREDLAAESVRWAAGGAPPVGGPARLPRERAGGGPIYPEREMRIGNVVVYYARNQKKDLLDAVEKDMPRAKQRIEQWLPSVPPDEPMYLIVSAGGGGGWAVNAYLPKETGVISLTPHGLLSVFAHELAHTMGGPPNAQGHLAAHWPQGNQGESHAGWFQGKINALFGDGVDQANRNANNLFKWDPEGDALDLAMDPRALREKWGKGKEWHKMWYVWQKLDDRYGPTWYPRWRWVQHTRWQDQPDRRLTWDETVEDMSIAVGEDLFPFFRKLGTTLRKSRFERAVFQGATIELPVAAIDVTPAGPVCLDPIGDYKKPLPPR